jgi:hypothetical protein
VNALTGTFAATAIAFYVGHHVGDYWVQTDHQARHKGEAGSVGHHACLRHVISYMLTQWCTLQMAADMLDFRLSFWGLNTALAVSGLTHYMADRREYGIMYWLARRIPGKAAFMKLGAPRQNLMFYGMDIDHTSEVEVAATDNPQLATGAWALDQSWHIFWGVFVAALLAVTL